MNEVELIEFEKVDLKGGTVIAGFPSIGLVSTVAANYLIDALGLKQVGALDSKYFPTLSVVHSAEPLSPVRIYAGVPDRGQKVAIFVSEFRPKPNLITPIADVIMKWVKEKSCRFLMSPEGMVVEGKETGQMKNESAYAIGATKFEVIKDIIFPYAKSGIIGSIILALGRALGETMAVAFVIGGVFNFPEKLTDPTVSIPVVLANSFAESSGMSLHVLFYLALILFVISFFIISFAKFYFLRDIKGSK